MRLVLVGQLARPQPRAGLCEVRAAGQGRRRHKVHGRGGRPAVGRKPGNRTGNRACSKAGLRDIGNNDRI